MSAQENILTFLRQNYPNIYSSGELQRMEWKNDDGTTGTPAIIQRRLRNLEEKKEIAVTYEGAKNHAHYQYLPEYKRAEYKPTALRKDSKAGLKHSEPKYKMTPEFTTPCTWL